MELVKKLLPYILIMGVFGFVATMVFGQGTAIYIQPREANGITYYYFNAHAYLVQIERSIGDTAILQLKMPETEWENITGNVLQEAFWKAIVNNLAVILNWIIFGLNVLVYPIRIGGYLLKQIIVLLGININGKHGLTWLVDFTKFIIQLQIPYVIV